MPKKEKHFYHVVTERPMQLGQVIVFDETHANGVFHRSMNADFKNADGLDALDITKQNLKHQKLSLNVADTDVLMKYLEWSIKGYRELILEIERQKLGIDAPSRLACLYVSDTLDDAEKWADYFIKLGRPTYQIVKLKVLGKSFSGNAYHIQTHATSIKKQVTLAQAYWMKAPHEKTLTETIVDGHIEVVEIIKEFERIK